MQRNSVQYAVCCYQKDVCFRCVDGSEMVCGCYALLTVRPLPRPLQCGLRTKRPWPSAHVTHGRAGTSALCLCHPRRAVIGEVLLPATVFSIVNMSEEPLGRRFRALTPDTRETTTLLRSPEPGRWPSFPPHVCPPELFVVRWSFLAASCRRRSNKYSKSFRGPLGQ